jgi:hypothetical protein
VDQGLFVFFKGDSLLCCHCTFDIGEILDNWFCPNDERVFLSSELGFCFYFPGQLWNQDCDHICDEAPMAVLPTTQKNASKLGIEGMSDMQGQG